MIPGLGANDDFVSKLYSLNGLNSLSIDLLYVSREISTQYFVDRLRCPLLTRLRFSYSKQWRVDLPVTLTALKFLEIDLGEPAFPSATEKWDYRQALMEKGVDHYIGWPWKPNADDYPEIIEYAASIGLDPGPLVRWMFRGEYYSQIWEYERKPWVVLDSKPRTLTFFVLFLLFPHHSNEAFEGRLLDRVLRYLQPAWPDDDIMLILSVTSYFTPSTATLLPAALTKFSLHGRNPCIIDLATIRSVFPLLPRLQELSISSRLIQNEDGTLSTSFSNMQSLNFQTDCSDCNDCKRMGGRFRAALDSQVRMQRGQSPEWS